MSTAYSNNALPAGTVLREWRLESVLGAGGLGIVYKARGIYFDERVVIKEYFPSSTSERGENDTVVPIAAASGEVHALGLKTFVEEAKLLWSLSTPARHPNIVSVRSMFEIHDTAYLVMDFEDGVPLANLLEQGPRWDEASLTAIFRGIAEGLERAHRVGVLHRDITPGNILINEDGRPVLIDFGSPRLESDDTASSKVTFHTPPYAAIEQYVRTYDQGPWTDVYALGVVLYECITGTKPREVLERMHGGIGKPLVDGQWPGYSRKFLHGVDAAMGIRPAERPQSISQWLALFDAPGEELDATIEAKEAEAGKTEKTPVPTVAPKAKAPVRAKSATAKKRTPLPLVIGMAGLALAGLGAAGWYFIGGFPGERGIDPAMVEPEASVAPVPIEAASGTAAAVQALADEAATAGAPAAAIARLAAAAEQLAGLDASHEAETSLIASKAAAEFAAILIADADARSARLARDVPWASPLRPGAAARENAERRKLASDIRFALSSVRAASAAAASAADPAAALTAARQALAHNGTLNALIARAYRVGNARPPADIPTAAAVVRDAPTIVAQVPVAAAAPPPAAVAASGGPRGRPDKLFPAKYRNVISIVRSARDVAEDVIKLGRGSAPGAGASAEEKEGYRVRQANAKAARDYLTYLDGLASSMRGQRTEADVDLNLANAERTRSYLRQILETSRAAKR